MSRSGPTSSKLYRLVAVAALGQALFGHVELNIAGALIIGSVPGTFVGARVSSRAPDAIVRTIVVALLASSGLALLVTSNAGLAWPSASLPWWAWLSGGPSTVPCTCRRTGNRRVMTGRPGWR